MRSVLASRSDGSSECGKSRGTDVSNCLEKAVSTIREARYSANPKRG
jgi:hypothetical protein